MFTQNKGLTKKKYAITEQKTCLEKYLHKGITDLLTIFLKPSLLTVFIDALHRKEKGAGGATPQEFHPQLIRDKAFPLCRHTDNRVLSIYLSIYIYLSGLTSE